MLDQFQRFGYDLFYRGLTSSHGGNMSVRMGDRIVITRTGSIVHTVRLPGQLTPLDGLWLAVPLYWLVLVLLG